MNNIEDYHKVLHAAGLKPALGRKSPKGFAPSTQSVHNVLWVSLERIYETWKQPSMT
jgi:hypothetical protein